MVDQIVGPYEITVGASPAPLTVGQRHLSVLVQRHRNALIVKHAKVTVTAIPSEGNSTPVVRQATHDQAADERQYGAEFTFRQAGRWEIVVDVDGPDGPAAAHFQVTVQRDFPVQLIVYLGLVGIPLAGAGLIAHWMRSGSKNAATEPEEQAATHEHMNSHYQ
jgi:hypothetical protein